jgi:hypothetical protein
VQISSTYPLEELPLRRRPHQVSRVSRLEGKQLSDAVVAYISLCGTERGSKVVSIAASRFTKGVISDTKVFLCLLRTPRRIVIPAVGKLRCSECVYHIEESLMKLREAVGGPLVVPGGDQVFLLGLWAPLCRAMPVRSFFSGRPEKRSMNPKKSAALLHSAVAVMSSCDASPILQSVEHCPSRLLTAAEIYLIWDIIRQHSSRDLVHAEQRRLRNVKPYGLSAVTWVVRLCLAHGRSRESKPL